MFRLTDIQCRSASTTRSGDDMGAVKAKKGKTSKAPKSSLGSKLVRAGSSILGGSSRGGGGGRRRKGPAYWANKVLVAKLKKKYWKIQYGGR